jgi:hypothetical protein
MKRIIETVRPARKYTDKSPFLKCFTEIEEHGLVAFTECIVDGKIRMGCLANLNTQSEATGRMPGFKHRA